MVANVRERVVSGIPASRAKCLESWHCPTLEKRTRLDGMKSRNRFMLIVQAHALATRSVFSVKTVFHLFHPVGSLLGLSQHD